MRLIDADALMRGIEDWWCSPERCDNYGGIRCRACMMDDAITAIDAAPTIDAAPVKHGRWIDVNRSDGLRECSVCHDWQIHYEKYIPNYCPTCGAKMDGDKNEAD